MTLGFGDFCPHLIYSETFNNCLDVTLPGQQERCRHGRYSSVLGAGEGLQPGIVTTVPCRRDSQEERTHRPTQDKHYEMSAWLAEMRYPLLHVIPEALTRRSFMVPPLIASTSNSHNRRVSSNTWCHTFFVLFFVLSRAAYRRVRKPRR